MYFYSIIKFLFHSILTFSINFIIQIFYLRNRTCSSTKQKELMTIRSIVFKNDIQRPSPNEISDSCNKTKEERDYENAIEAIRQRKYMSKDGKRDPLRKYSSSSSNEEIPINKSFSNNYFFGEQNWSAQSNNRAEIMPFNKTTTESTYGNSTRKNRNTIGPKDFQEIKKHYTPVPPTRNRSASTKRRPLPKKPKSSFA